MYLSVCRWWRASLPVLCSLLSLAGECVLSGAQSEEESRATQQMNSQSSDRPASHLLGGGGGQNTHQCRCTAIAKIHKRKNAEKTIFNK